MAFKPVRSKSIENAKWLEIKNLNVAKQQIKILAKQAFLRSKNEMSALQTVELFQAVVAPRTVDLTAST